MSNDNYFEFTRNEMAAFLPKSYSKVLEIGCGIGKFSSCLNHSVEYWGIEKDKKSAQSATKRLDKVLTGYFEDVGT